MELTKNVIVSDDFSELDLSTKIGASSSYTINNGILQIDSISGDNGWAEYPTTVDRYSMVEISCVAKLGNGTLEGKVAINLGESDTDRNVMDSADLQSEEWMPYIVRYPVHPKYSHAFLTVGLWSDMEGTVYFRDINIKIYNGNL